MERPLSFSRVIFLKAEQAFTENVHKITFPSVTSGPLEPEVQFLGMAMRKIAASTACWPKVDLKCQRKCEKGKPYM